MTTVARRQRAGLSTWVFVQGGALIFFASLAYGIAAYLGPFGRAIPARSWIEEAGAVGTNVALFTLFAAHHSLMARSRAKAWLIEVVPRHLERTTYVWIASLLFLLVCWAWRPVGGEVYHLRGLPGWVAAGVQVTGLLLTVASVRILNWAELAGVRQAEGRTTAAMGQPMFSRGIYGVVRHPLYLAWILMTCATPHMTGTRLVFAAVSSSYLLLAIPWEERSLIAEHGESYARYRRQVRGRIIPGIY